MTDRLRRNHAHHPFRHARLGQGIVRKVRLVGSGRLSNHDAHTQVTELLLQVILAARTLGLLVGATRLVPAERDMAALQLLATLGPLRASELAVMLGISRGAATRLVDALEHAGLAHREPDPRDRRAVLIAPTPTGRIVALADIAPAVVLAEAIERLDSEQVASLLTGLEALVRELLRSLPKQRSQTAASSRTRRSTNGIIDPPATTSAPARNGQPDVSPPNSASHPAARAPSITPSE